MNHKSYIPSLSVKNTARKAALFSTYKLLLIVGLLILSCLSTAQTDSVTSELEHALLYTARDSMDVDFDNQKAKLYGAAHVEYGEIILDACYIEFDFESKSCCARLCKDSSNHKIEIPELTNGDTKTQSDSLCFNFETKRGITYFVKMQEGESYIHGTTVKRQKNGDIHIDTALYTTCNLDHPHYYFKLRRAIIKPEDKIVAGPTNLYIADIPTPLGLPFAFLPNKPKNNGASGIVLPSYGNNAALGFSLVDGGYFHKFKNEKITTQALGTVYSQGSWGLKNITAYKVKYKYSGSFNISYTVISTGYKELPDYTKKTNFFVRWNHLKDIKSKPGSNFSASVNAGSVNNFKNSFGDVNNEDYLSNNFNSTISWGKRLNLFNGKLPTNFSTTLRHFQNNATTASSFTLPDATFNVNRFFPTSFFPTASKSGIKSGLRKGIDKIGIDFASNFKNNVEIVDTLISLNEFQPFIDSMNYGARNNATISYAGKFLKVFTVSPSYKWSSLLYDEQFQYSWNEQLDTLQKDTINGFNHPMWHAFNINVSTKIYTFYGFAKFLEGERKTRFRHTITPNVSGTYIPKPNYTKTYITKEDSVLVNNVWNYIPADTVDYSPYSRGIFGGPPTSESARLSFNLINVFEMRQANIKDTTGAAEDKKISLLENLTLSSGYDFLKEEFKLDNIILQGRTTIFKIFTANFGATLDPYIYDTLGVRYDEYQYLNNGKLGTITNARGAFGITLRSKRGHKGNYSSKHGTDAELAVINANKDLYNDLTIPWTLTLNHTINYQRSMIAGRDNSISNGVMINGTLNLTSNWSLMVNTNYDFKQQKFSYTRINIVRDLHCWEIRFDWIPFGIRQSYNLQINVKSALLQDLKLQRRRQMNAVFGF